MPPIFVIFSVYKTNHFMMHQIKVVFGSHTNLEVLAAVCAEKAY